MVGIGAVRDGDMALQVTLDGLRRFPRGEAETVGYAEYVGVYGDDGLVVDDGSDDVGRLPPDAGKAHQRIDVGRDLPIEIRKKFPGHGGQVLGLAVRVGDAFDIGKDFLRGRGREGSGVGEAPEQGGSHEIDPLVRALGGEDHGAEELEYVPVAEFRFGDGPVLGEPAYDAFEALFPGHQIVTSDSTTSGAGSSPHFSSVQENTRPG